MKAATIAIRSIKQHFPGVPIVVRLLHRVGDAVLKTGEVTPERNFCTDLRIHQMRQMQLALARQEGLAFWDFGRLFEGFQEYASKVHPLSFPGGAIMAQLILHQAYLASAGADSG